MSMTELEAAVDAARALLGWERGMDSLRMDLENRVHDEIDDAARRAGNDAAKVWQATPCNIQDVAVQDILGEVAF